ncbi:transcriptional regulator [Flavobacterium rivuli WB 3.3-2 = DSM 21788]|uniref:Transcriptional regulator n=1 Tax=Flavobacterium rivuli WB 3.3-2 = DSM 21788 TaxID=1121895 RepID=A0A0A2M101_9FLAO|nr:response regulator [Flavobacterium rivuli]KGO86307.1 transcriptional regulator [Flavobacterium rivuli WB 3.3-2 = DSM 21788]
MFKKILVSEDIDSISFGLVSILQKNYPSEIRTTKYCDDALLKIKAALHEGKPYDLLITDLSFKDDYRDVKLSSGEELIEAAKSEQPGLKIIVYSIDDKPYRIKNLFDKHKINAFVAKGRDSSTEIIEAMDIVHDTDTIYTSPQLSHIARDMAILEIDEDDIILLKYLSDGRTQPEISELLKNAGKASSSTSSIEKRINKLKIYFKANNAIHLISTVKDMGII